jgi:hypothetical protein
MIRVFNSCATKKENSERQALVMSDKASFVTAALCSLRQAALPLMRLCHDRAGAPRLGRRRTVENNCTAFVGSRARSLASLYSVNVADYATSVQELLVKRFIGQSVTAVV